MLRRGRNGPDIYRYIMERNGLTDRQAFKEKFYEEVLFGKIPKKFKKVVKVFKAEFPLVWDYICELKADDYSQLAINLQKLESAMFIGCAAELMKKGVKVLTLHDALYVIDTPDNIELTDRTILSRFQKAIPGKTNNFRVNDTKTNI